MDKINNILDYVGKNLGLGLKTTIRNNTKDLKDWILNNGSTYIHNKEELKKDKIKITSVQTPLGKINFILNGE